MYLVSGDDLSRADGGHEGATTRESGAEDLPTSHLVAALIEADVSATSDSRVTRGVEEGDTSQADLYGAQRIS